MCGVVGWGGGVGGVVPVSRRRNSPWRPRQRTRGGRERVWGGGGGRVCGGSGGGWGDVGCRAVGMWGVGVGVGWGGRGCCTCLKATKLSMAAETANPWRYGEGGCVGPWVCGCGMWDGGGGGGCGMGCRGCCTCLKATKLSVAAETANPFR